MDAVDKGDAAQFTLGEILHPTGWVLLNFLMDPRTGLGRFRDFRISNYQLMMELIDVCTTLSVEEILELPDVAERVELYFEHAEKAVEQIKRCATVHDNLVVLDLRDEEVIHPTNRFTIYALFPHATSRSTCSGASSSRTRCSPPASRSSIAAAARTSVS